VRGAVDCNTRNLAAPERVRGFGSRPVTVVQRQPLWPVGPNFCGWKDRKAVAKDPNWIYQAVDDGEVEKALDDFAAEWGSKYPSNAQAGDGPGRRSSGGLPSRRRALRSIPRSNRQALQLRKIFCPTNPIESLNRVIRKTTKTRGGFPTDDAAPKLIYLAIRKFEKAGRYVRQWVAARNQIAILYPERFNRCPVATAWAAPHTQGFGCSRQTRHRLLVGNT